VPVRSFIDKPFCDGTHSKIGFQAPNYQPESAE